MLIHEGRFEDALTYNQNTMQYSPYDGERIVAEIDYLELEQNINHTRVEGVRGGGRLANMKRIEELTQRLEGMDLLQKSVVTPTEFKLANAYPNPFNSRTSVRCDFPERASLSLKLYDISGREVYEVAEKTLDAGSHTFNIDAETLPSGLYYCQMEAGTYKQTIKLALIR